VTKVVPAVTPEVKDALVKNIRRRMTPQPLKIQADVEMKCFQFDGVLHIKVLFATIHAVLLTSVYI
jgi:translation initiation factor 2 subunit 1